MQLDENRIVIRERSYLEILDLSLRVIRSCAGRLAAAFALGVVPVMLFNAWLTAGAVGSGVQEEMPSGYMYGMFLLVLLEAPLATAPLTLFLGQSLFSDRFQGKKLARDFAGSLPQLLLYQVLLRALLIPLHITWLLLFVAWPYLNEVILLERNPLQRGRANRVTTNRRMTAMHAGSSGDLFARWIIAVLVGAMLFLSVWFSIWCLAGVLAGDWEWDGIVYTLYYPLALWLVVGFFAVVRFLGYLDLRIRREGWEVELMMRAEASRLERQLA
jgi:hypothetical protein